MFLKPFLICSFTSLLGIWRITYGTEEGCDQSQLFVDKTSLIKELFKRNTTHLVTVPLGFGKTTNLDMIRRFCEIQVNEEGRVIPSEKTKYYKIFSDSYLKDNSKSFLNVYEDEVFFRKHFSQYPIIHIDFSLLNYESLLKFMDSWVKTISELFNTHKYLLSSNNINDKETITYRNYQFHVICKELETVKLKESVTFLASLLYKYFSKNVILLMDEIDSVLHSAIMQGYSDTQEIVTFMADLLSDVLNSNFILKSVLNSSSRLVDVLIKNITNVDHFLFNKKHPFNKFYGYTEREVTTLAELYNLKNNMSLIRDWYNGYNIAKSNLKMYNFHSITNMLFKKDIGTYWIKGKNPKMFEHLFLKKNIRRKIKSVINEGFVKIEPVEEITMRDVNRLKEIFKNIKFTKISPEDENLILNYMFDLGYFSRNNNEECSILKLRVPNIETKSELLDLIYSMPYFKNKLNLTDEEIISVNETFLDNKISKFIKEPVLSSSH